MSAVWERLGALDRVLSYVCRPDDHDGYDRATEHLSRVWAATVGGTADGVPTRLACVVRRLTPGAMEALFLSARGVFLGVVPTDRPLVVRVLVRHPSAIGAPSAHRFMPYRRVSYRRVRTVGDGVPLYLEEQ